jgi:hypothetical protein
LNFFVGCEQSWLPDACLRIIDSLNSNAMDNALADIENRSNLSESPLCQEFALNNRGQGELLHIARWDWKIGSAVANGSSFGPGKLPTSAGLSDIQWERWEKDDVAFRHSEHLVGIFVILSGLRLCGYSHLCGRMCNAM